MTGHRPFRFGVVAGIGGVQSRTEWVTNVRTVEELGYAAFHMLDHLTVDLPPLIALMAAADATSTLRIGSAVLCNDYRHPAVLAKEVAALDLLSDGRFEFGIGCGWQQSEYEQAGIPYDSAGVRISRLEESLAIMKGLFAGGPVSFAGKYYTVSELHGSPKPLQRPYPPIYLGGGGKRMLSIAAREADIVGILPIANAQQSWQNMSDATAEATLRKMEWIREAAGNRFEQLELQTNIFAVVVTDHPQQVIERMAGTFGITKSQMLHLPHFLIGTVEHICEELLARRERYGISYISIRDIHKHDFAPVVARLSGK